MPDWAETRAREWLEYVYTNGQGEQATRLVLINDGPPRRDLGGLGREVLRDRLAALLRDVRKEGVAEVRRLVDYGTAGSRSCRCREEIRSRLDLL